METISAQPPPGPPVISPDGLWLWTGAQWVPRTAQSAYGSATVRARWTVALFGAWIVSAAILVAADLTRISIANGIISGSDVSLSDAQNSDTFVRGAAWVHLAIFLSTVIVFLVWLHRVVANNHALRPGRLRFTPGWAVGWWFVPFMNLVRPFQVVSESWQAADPNELALTATSRSRQRTPVLLFAWWALYLIGNLTAGLERINAGDPATTLRNAAQFDIASIVILSVAAVLAITIVLRLSKRQETLAPRLGL